jgi:hypothetical protein
LGPLIKVITLRLKNIKLSLVMSRSHLNLNYRREHRVFCDFINQKHYHMTFHKAFYSYTILSVVDI